MLNPQRSSLPWIHVFRNTETTGKCFSWSIFLCTVMAVISGVVLVSDFFKALCYEESKLVIIKTRS
jgi:cytochrome b subunit of formate dehydrogenase